MPKTTKKVATKKTVAKKAPVKKTVKKTVKTKPVVNAAPVVTETTCNTPCCCGGHCHCGKGKKFIVLACTFIIGFLVSQLFFCGCCGHKRAPKIEFVNGCVNVASVKCPKMLEKIQSADANHDGCVTKVELRAVKKAMHHQRPSAKEPAVVDAIAPVME